METRYIITATSNSTGEVVAQTAFEFLIDCAAWVAERFTRKELGGITLSYEETEIADPKIIFLAGDAGVFEV